MSNKVVTTLARAFARLGADAVRFNFRGVGASQGRYADGVGERDDALAVVAWCRARWPDRRLYLGGFSFGAAVAAAIAARVAPAGLVTVAPPVDKLPPDFVAPSCPWLLVHGEADDVVPAGPVIEWCATLASAAAHRAAAGRRPFFPWPIAGTRTKRSLMRSAPTSVRFGVVDDAAQALRAFRQRVRTRQRRRRCARACVAGGDGVAVDRGRASGLRGRLRRRRDDARVAEAVLRARRRGRRRCCSRKHAQRPIKPSSSSSSRAACTSSCRLPRSNASWRCCGRWRWRTAGSTSTRITSCAGSPSSYMSRIPISSASATACGRRSERRRHSSTKNCFLNRTVKRLGSLLGVTSIV